MKIIMKFIITLALVLILPFSVFSESSESSESSETSKFSESSELNNKTTSGKQLYDAFCARCHGFKGEGDGYDSGFTFPKPRDFTVGTYKFRSTPTGDPPIDDDIRRSIKKGAPGTAMEPWKRFSNNEIKNIVEHLKNFSPDAFEFTGEPIAIKNPPLATEEIIKNGRRLFKEAKCRECHGNAGRGNGTKGWKKTFKDDWGEKIYPANHTHGWELKNGSSVEDIFRTITTGIDGTPMPSHQDSYTDDQRWALAYFVKSLQIKRKISSVVNAVEVDDIPSSLEDELWAEADYIDMPMEGPKAAISSASQYFKAMITNMRARVLYTDSEVAIMLEWSDRKPDKGDDGLPPDAVRLQFPVKILSEAKNPYSGERKIPLNFWDWKASDNLAPELNTSTSEEEGKKISKHKLVNIKATANYKDGLYRVMFIRQIDTENENDINFSSNTFIPFSVIAYDGKNNEKDDRSAISEWHYIKIEL